MTGQIRQRHSPAFVYIPADACGDISPEAHQRSMDRAVQAGAVPITSLQYVFELQQDSARARDL
jgi:hypothetical protein